MVSPALEESLGSLSRAERIDVIGFLQRTLRPGGAGLTDAEQSLTRSRDADMDADPPLAVTWGEVDTALQDVWG